MTLFERRVKSVHLAFHLRVQLRQGLRLECALRLDRSAQTGSVLQTFTLFSLKSFLKLIFLHIVKGTQLRLHLS